MNMYVDVAGSEFSIHCLIKEDMELLADATVELFNTLSKQEKTEEHRAAKIRLINLKNILENGY